MLLGIALNFFLLTVHYMGPRHGHLFGEGTTGICALLLVLTLCACLCLFHFNITPIGDFNEQPM